MPSAAPPAAALTDARFDFPPAGQPTFHYMIATAPRAGSTLLCRQLWQTGQLGAPWEYFDFRRNKVAMIARLGVTSLAEYVSRLYELRTSPNRVFGFKATLPDFQFIKLARLRFPGARVIWITRNDRVAQAVSLARAWQTQKWSSLDEGSAGPPIYEFSHIQNCFAHIAREHAGWKSFFRKNIFAPIRVDYDDLVADPDAVVRQIMTQFGIEPDPTCGVDLPPIGRQFDATSEEWIARFRRDAAARSIPTKLVQVARRFYRCPFRPM